MNLQTRLFYITFSLVLNFTLFSSPLFAHPKEDENKISVVTLSASADSDDGYEYFLDSNIALPDGQRLSLSIGEMVIKSTESDHQIEPMEVMLGLASGSEVSFPVMLDLDYWEEEHTEVKTLRGGMGYQSDLLGVWVKPQIREFSFNAIRREFSSEGYSISIDVQLEKNVSLFTDYSKNYYSEIFLLASQVVLLNNLARLKLMNSVGFADHIFRVGGSVYFERGTINGYWLRNTSAIDSAISYGYGGSLDVDLVDQFSIGFAVDAQTAEQADSDFYSGTLSVSYYW